MDFNRGFHMPPLLSLQDPRPPLDVVGDPNNNNEDDGGGGGDPGARVDGRAKGEKYSLRPRSGQKRAAACELVDVAPSKRSVVGGGRPKQKPPPLSKYRRKTANARERDRMREINAAFESLRRAVPHPAASDSCQAGEKLTKITTLRLAMRYISALSQALQQDAADPTTTTTTTTTTATTTTMNPAARGFDLADLLSDCGGEGAPDLDALLSDCDDESLYLRSDLSDASSFTPPDFGSEHPGDCRASLATPVFGDPSDLEQLFS